MNAVIASGVAARQWTALFDSAWIDPESERRSHALENDRISEGLDRKAGRPGLEPPGVPLRTVLASFDPRRDRVFYRASAVREAHMPTLKLSQIIERPASDVFSVIVDVANLARWNPTIKSARKVSDGEPAEGTRFEMEVQGFGNVPQTLEEVQRDRSARYVPHFKAMSGGHRFLLTAQGAATRVDHELEMTPKGIFKLMAPFMARMGRKNLRRTADALKEYVESRK
jgi:uncharacterized protein YndB with AHSA1/START domain